MKTCCVCRRPDVRWPLSIVCHWCLQGEMERAVDQAIRKPRQVGMAETIINDPSAREPIGTNQPAPDFWKRARVATVTPSGKIVLGARP